jgi:hypothetical protein
MKANNTWIYIYLNQGESIVTSCGYYVPNGSNWMPFTVRKIYEVTEELK